MRTTRRNYTPEEGLQYAAGLCARCEQCEYDIRIKLSRHGLPARETDRIIDYLYDRSFLDELRFAEAFTRDKIRFSGWGKVKVRAHLRARRIPGVVIDKALESVGAEEYLAFVDTLARRLAKGCDLADYATRQKLVRRLAARGVEPSLASRALGRLKYGEE